MIGAVRRTLLIFFARKRQAQGTGTVPIVSAFSFPLIYRAWVAAFQKEKELELAGKVEELWEEVRKLEGKNQSLASELEQVKKAEQSIAKTYEDRLKVVHWMCKFVFQ